MAFLSLFRPKNALILATDHLTEASTAEWEAQITEVSQYYRLVKLSELVSGLKHKRFRGMASVVFTNARKSVYLRGIPLLISQEIPFTVFLRADCIGSNRLPLEDEWDFFHQAYASRMGSASREEFHCLCWESPQEAEAVLQGFRGTLGPLPINTADPMRFFNTWGKIIDTPPSFQELGVHVPHSPSTGESLREGMTFIRQQTKAPITVAFCPRPAGSSDMWGALGIEGVLTNADGQINRSTDPLALPQWKFKKASSEDEKEEGNDP